MKRILLARRVLPQVKGCLAGGCAMVALTALLASCASQAPIGTDYGAEADRFTTLVDLNFVTNRKLVAAATSGAFFADEAGDLSGGRCRVGFSERVPRGEVLRIDTQRLDSAMAGDGPGQFVIYVHGYGESLTKSCRRAALLQQRLGLGQRLLLFSWPSSNYLTYGQDAVALERSLDSLKDTLAMANGAIGAPNMVIMAHSMGARGVVDALKEWDPQGPRFSEIIFVAPDVGREEFLDDVRMLREKASQITVYASSNDVALWLSTTINGSARLGVTKEMDLQHANLIDVSRAGLKTPSGHTYHIFNPAVAEDLRAVLGSAPADGKRAFRRVPGSVEHFWVLEPVAAETL